MLLQLYVQYPCNYTDLILMHGLLHRKHTCRYRGTIVWPPHPVSIANDRSSVHGNVAMYFSFQRIRLFASSRQVSCHQHTFRIATRIASPPFRIATRIASPPFDLLMILLTRFALMQGLVSCLYPARVYAFLQMQ